MMRSGYVFHVLLSKRRAGLKVYYEGRIVKVTTIWESVFGANGYNHKLRLANQTLGQHCVELTSHYQTAWVLFDSG